MKRKKKKLQLLDGMDVYVYYFLETGVFFLTLSDTGTSTLGPSDVSVGTLVEFLIPGKAATGTVIDFVPAQRKLGTISRPAGKRKWWVEDAEGNEHLVNR
jgi:hypothetical protein